MNEEYFFIRLRDCFTAGYTMPQFCLDNGIKKPLFVAKDAGAIPFIWEIYAQFKYNLPVLNSLQADFALINGKVDSVNFSVAAITNELKIKNIAEISTAEDFDFIISLTDSSIKFNFPRVIYLDALTNYFITTTYAETPLLHFAQKNPGVKLFAMDFPCLMNDENNSEREKQLYKEIGLYLLFEVRKNIERAAGKEKVDTPLDFLGYTNEEVYNLLETADLKVNPDGSSYLLENKNNPFVGVVNGKRFVPNQPQNYKNKIYFIGNCVYYGFGVPFYKTIESQLQNLLNVYNLPYRVENEAQPFSGRYSYIFYNLNKLPVQAGDIVFVNIQNLVTQKIPFISTSILFKRPHNFGEVFLDNGHINELGHKALAESFFNFLTQNNFFQNVEFKYPAPPPPPHRYGIPKENFFGTSNLAGNKDLQTYKENLREKRLKIGATVMNCNPFTLGHKALIEYAAARVKKLYIFVVEEDKSEFKFADRLKLVQGGVEEFPNVEVLPSGKFIISQQTFSGYFNKAELQNVAVDSTQDVEIFAREIAPVLGINIRFAGAEPEDTVTRQYNENMKNILPRYGIDFCEIPRKEFNGEVISAKSVRAALKVGDFEKIKKLVPKTTFKFLIENYSTPPHCRLTKIKLLLILIKSAQKLGSYCNVKL